MPADGRVRLAAGSLELEVAPEIGGSIAAFRLRSDGGRVPLMRESPADYADVLESACFPLVPYSNRIRDGRFSFGGREVQLSANMLPQRHPLHGTGWRAPWDVVSKTEAACELAYRHEPGEWPWAFEARQRFALDEGGLTLELECRNASGEPMPCGLGLHPYFVSDAETVLSLNTTQVWTIDEEIMPVALEPSTGRYELSERRIDRADLDNGYEGWDGAAEIRWLNRGATLRILSPEVTRFQVYSPAEGGVFCAEPVTHANDALSHPPERWRELGVRIIQPGESTALSTRFEVRAP